MHTQTRASRHSRLAAAFWRLVLAWRSLVARHPAMRFVQIIPIGLLLWGLDDLARFRAGAAVAGRHNALVVNSVSATIGGASTHLMNDWTVGHSAAALASSWYYILLQGAITGVVGAVILWRRISTFSLHRNALVAITLLGLVAWWLYPVAPPRMLPGYHDVIAVTIPSFTSVVETKGAAQFASLPSLHVAWAIWAAIALCAVVRKPLPRAIVWLYPLATVTDVLATGNHYVLDIVTAPGLVLLGYAVALTHAFVRWLRPRQVLRFLSPLYLSMYYLSLRNVLLPSLSLSSLALPSFWPPDRLLHREPSSSWCGQSQMIPGHGHSTADPRVRRRPAYTGSARLAMASPTASASQAALRPTISAHRGGSEGVRPDTYDAYWGALEAGAEFVEFDVRRTADRELVAFHDPRLGRRRPVGVLNYADLCRVAGYEVPTVSGILGLLAGRAGAHIDLKERGCLAAVAVQARSVLEPNQIIVTTGDEAAIRELRRRFPEVPCGLTVGGDLAQTARYLTRRARGRVRTRVDAVVAVKAQWAVVQERLACAGALAECRRRGLATMVWTVNDDTALARWLTSLDVDVLVTDRPRRAAELRRQAGP